MFLPELNEFITDNHTTEELMLLLSNKLMSLTCIDHQLLVESYCLLQLCKDESIRMHTKLKLHDIVKTMPEHQIIDTYLALLNGLYDSKYIYYLRESSVELMANVYAYINSNQQIRDTLLDKIIQSAQNDEDSFVRASAVVGLKQLATDGKISRDKVKDKIVK